MGLLERISASTVRRRGEVEHRYSADQYFAEYVAPNIFGYQGAQYPFGLNTTWSYSKAQEYSGDLPGHAAALRGCPPAFAAQMVRALVLSQARFTYRSRATTGAPRRTFGTRDLGLLEQPWPKGTTSELIGRMEWHAGPAGTSFVLRQPGRLRVLRPDYVMVIYGSQQEPDMAATAIDGEIIGFVYVNGGVAGLAAGAQARTLLPSDVAIWAPIPDPERAGLGMSWLTPAIREIQGDRMATEHKIKFFENGATPNLVVKGIQNPDGSRLSSEQFNEIVDMLEDRHTGVRNAYRTLYLTSGADATVVGSNLQQIDFAATQGRGETRLSVLSRVPAALLGISEGLAGSTLNSGNFGMARRMFADSWIYPSLQDLAASLAPIVTVPSDAELWFNVEDMPILREDARDAAEILQIQAATIVSLVNGGYVPESVVPGVTGGDLSQIKHSGLLSVQLQPPGALAAPAQPKALPVVPPAQPKALPVAPARSDEEDLDERAGGVDTHPGGEQLKHYWLHGEGAAKWSTWTELYHHLVKYLSPDMAKRTAAEWFHQRYGIWPGADLNRVTHGKPPRGKVVGPG